MDKAPPRRRRWLVVAVLGVIAFFAVALEVFRGDLIMAVLDPAVPFQTYQPPPAPDYAKPSSWALMPARVDAPTTADLPADVFFIGPTTFDGGKHWNAPIDDKEADRLFRTVMAPNYAGPFVRVGRIFAPRYRQAGLYSLLTLREDARAARAFAYEDIARAYRAYRDRYGAGRPLVIVGVEQGGALAARLLSEEIALDPAARKRLVAAYLIETVTPAADPPIPPCERRAQSGCLAAWVSVSDDEFERARRILDRALVWTPKGDLENLSGSALCFNPILGAVTDKLAPAHLHEGAANATGLEWGARPAFLARQISARCEGGVLHTSSPKSSSLRRTGGWIERRRVPGYNLFYADLEADARARVAALTAP